MDPEVKRQVETFFSNYPMRRFSKGEILIFAGENPNGVFYLRQGNVRQYDVMDNGDEAVVNLFKPPAFFPMNYAINQRPNDYFYRAVNDVEANVSPLGDVLDFVKRNPDILLDLLARVYNGVDGVLRRQIYLMGGKSDDQLVYELILSCRRVGELQPSGACLVRLSETELAARSGLSRETVNRRLKKLKRQKLVRVQSDGLVVPDIAALERRLYAGDEK